MSESLCFKHNKHHVYSESECPWCQIDRLKAQLEEAEVKLQLKVLKATDEHCADYMAELECQLVDARTKLTTWPDIFDENMRLATANDTLRDQLSEARAEIKQLKTECNRLDDMTRFSGAYQAVKQARQDVAMQIIQYIIDQGVIDAGTIARPMLVYEIAECDITELKKRYGLEVRC